MARLVASDKPLSKEERDKFMRQYNATRWALLSQLRCWLVLDDFVAVVVLKVARLDSAGSNDGDDEANKAFDCYYFSTVLCGCVVSNNLMTLESRMMMEIILIHCEHDRLARGSQINAR